MAVLTIRAIKNQKDYEQTLKRIDEIFDAQPGTSEGDELEILAMMVNAYEEKHFPIEKSDPIEVIKFIMEQQGLRQVDLVPYMGRKNRVSEVLNGKRALTLEMIKNLHTGLHIPLEALLRV